MQIIPDKRLKKVHIFMFWENSVNLCNIHKKSTIQNKSP